MNKKLLSAGLALLALCGAGSVSANTTILKSSDATDFDGTYSKPAAVNYGHYDPINSLSINNWKFSFDKGTGTTNPTYYEASSAPSYTIRLYADNVTTITAPEGCYVTGITVTCKSAKNYDTTEGAAVGYINGKLPLTAESTTAFSWTAAEGESGYNQLTLSFPSWKESSTDDDGNVTETVKYPNMQIIKFDVTYEAVKGKDYFRSMTYRNDGDNNNDPAYPVSQFRIQDGQDYLFTDLAVNEGAKATVHRVDDTSSLANAVCRTYSGTSPYAYYTNNTWYGAVYSYNQEVTIAKGEADDEVVVSNFVPSFSELSISNSVKGTVVASTDTKGYIGYILIPAQEVGTVVAPDDKTIAASLTAAWDSLAWASKPDMDIKIWIKDDYTLADFNFAIMGDYNGNGTWWYWPVYAQVYLNDNGTGEYALTEYNSMAVVEFDPELSEDGEYFVSVPAKQFSFTSNGEKYFNDAVTFSFSVNKEASAAVSADLKDYVRAVSPEEGEVASLPASISLQVKAGVYKSDNFEGKLVVSKDGEELVSYGVGSENVYFASQQPDLLDGDDDFAGVDGDDNFGVDAEDGGEVTDVLYILLPKEYTEVGSYQVVIPDGFFSYEETALNGFELSYGVREYSDNLADYVTSVYPEEGEIDLDADLGLYMTYIGLNCDKIEKNLACASPVTLSDSEGKVLVSLEATSSSVFLGSNAGVAYNKMRRVEEAEDGVDDSFGGFGEEEGDDNFGVSEEVDYIYVSWYGWDEALTAAGNYVVTIPDGFFKVVGKELKGMTLNYNIGGEVTGVSSLAKDNASLSVYSIDGIRQSVSSLSELNKGLYIVNGKKVLVRK